MYAGFIIMIVLPILMLILGIAVVELEKREDRKSDKASGVFQVAILVMVLILVLCIPAVIILRTNCRREIVKFEEKRTIVEQSIGQGEYNENIGTTATIVEANEWLACARAELKIMGMWSPYYGLGIEDIKPIMIEEKK